MDGDAEALFSPDIELSSSLAQAFSHLVEHALTVCLGRVVCPICFFFLACEEDRFIWFDTVLTFGTLDVIEGNVFIQPQPLFPLVV